MRYDRDSRPADDQFVGRGLELDQVGALLLGSARLVTLIGPGGIGKTRLAEEAVRRVHRARRTVVFAVRLAGLPAGSGAAVVRDAVASSVLVEGFMGASGWDGAVQALSPRDAAGRVIQTMLVMDNCEHVLAGAGAVIADLLDAVPGLRMAATSREPVGWIEEQLVTVPPLSAQQSLELFGQRAELASHPITEPAQVMVAQQICERMHGHPLFIRLAAARMFYEPLPLILEQLSGESGDRRMCWRHGPWAGSDDRHRAIGDVIGWSYALCADKERLLFDRLSVFAPGHDLNPEDTGTDVTDVGAELEAIEVVLADDVPIMGSDGTPSTGTHDPSPVRLARNEIRDLLDRLVEQSLVSIHMSTDTVRYFLLESLRLFASDRLAERSNQEIDEPARLARRHSYYYRDKLLLGYLEWFSPTDLELLDWARRAWPNIRRAVNFSLQPAGEPVVGLQICVGLMALRALFLIGSLPEIRSRVEQILAVTQESEPEQTELQLIAMAQLAWIAIITGRPRDAEDLLEQCITACGADPAREGNWRDQPDTYNGLPAVVDFTWGAELMLIRRDPRAIAVLARAREKFDDIPDRGGVGMSELFEALAAGFFGSAEQAMTISQRYLERTTAAGAEWERSMAYLPLTIALIKGGDAEEALNAGRAALTFQLRIGDRWGMMYLLHVRMWALARSILNQIAAGNPARSALIALATDVAYHAGGLKTLRAQLGVLIENLGPMHDVTCIAAEVAREVLGQQAYIDAEERGSRLSPERFELHRLALGTFAISTNTRDHRPKQRSPSPWQLLSKAEREVAILAAAGWPNSTIGVRRGTSIRTADAQMSSIFQKLMIVSREQIIDFVPDDQRDRVSAERARNLRQA
jgi:predicted ATPase/DNA-binding CsgD family transcriptional regulator